MMEIIAVIFSLVSVWLTTIRNIWCWIIGIIGIIAYSFIFYDKCDWGNFGLQFIFLLQSIWAWINWNKPEKEIKKLPKGHFTKILLSILSLSTLIYLISYSLNGNLLLLDSTTSSISLFAMFLLGYKKIEAWILWIIADILYILFFMMNGLYLSSFLYFIFLLLAVYGFFNWKNKII